MNDNQRRAALRSFIGDWKERGSEKSDAAFFWLELLTALGSENPTKSVDLEREVDIDGHTCFIDLLMVHMAWMRVVCGRLEMRYRYSSTIVCNNFPWCTPTIDQRAAIERTAQAILDARAQFPDRSLASLYDETEMPDVLRAAHAENDRAVMEAYNFDASLSESEIVSRLMQMYRELITAERSPEPDRR